MKSIGVDIDGVLNNQTEHFCITLQRVRGKKLLSENVVRIPVRHLEGMELADEHAVFHSMDYWIELEAVAGASTALKILQEHGHKLRMFTWRGWPSWPDVPKDERVKLAQAWSRELRCNGLLGRLPYYPSWLARWISSRAMIGLTRGWLEENEIPYDSVTVEKNASRVESKRLREAKRGRFHYFVEDDAKSAVSLAPHCELVFLIDKPYNAQPETPLPDKVVRVESWEDILNRVTQAGTS